MQKTIRQWKEELVGKKFNRLTVLDVVQGFTKSGIKDGFRASCLCSCGNHVVVRIYALLNNNTMSCGCLALETQKKTGTKNFDEWKKKHPDILLENMAKAREKAKVWGKSHPDKIREKYQKMLECSKKWREEHPEEAKNNSKKAISIAHEWNKNHPEEMKIISEKGLHAIKKWREEHPEEAKNNSKKAAHQALKWYKEHPKESSKIKKSGIVSIKAWRKENKEIIRTWLLSSITKEEQEIYEYLCSLGYSIEQQFLLEGHYFDFRINNFLIEYNGSMYHYTEYKNKSNVNAKEPPTNKKEKNYHRELKELANRNNFNLIQVWDYIWFNNKEFIQKLIKDQLSGTVKYKDYLDENNLLNNDYGFDIDGEQVEPKSFWISTCNPKRKVDDTYMKGKVLIFNSGYTLCTCV